MSRYVVKDRYDFDETLIETDDLNVAYEAALTRIADTDGECTVGIYDMQTAPYPTDVVCVVQWGEEEEG